MHPIVRRPLAALAAVVALGIPAGLAASAAPAGAATTVAHNSIVGDPPSPEQAGYQVSGGNFRFITGQVYLRNPAGYASEVAGYGYSVQLYSASRVVVLGVSAGTSPASAYSPGIAVFNPVTRGVVCAESSCPGYPGGWASGLSYPTGHYVTLSAYYDASTGNVTLTVHDVTAGTSSAATYDAGAGQKFTSARIGAEFGDTPWSTFTYHHPAAAAKVAAFSNGEVTNYKGTRYALGAGVKGYPAFAPVYATSDGTSAGTTEVTPSAISSGGFAVTMQP